MLRTIKFVFVIASNLWSSNLLGSFFWSSKSMSSFLWSSNTVSGHIDYAIGSEIILFQSILFVISLQIKFWKQIVYADLWQTVWIEIVWFHCRKFIFICDDQKQLHDAILIYIRKIEEKSPYQMLDLAQRSTSF